MAHIAKPISAQPKAPQAVVETGMDGFGDPGLIVAGIDPGLSGALAVLNEEDDCETTLMPKMEKLVDGGAIARWLGDHGVQLAIVEQAQAFPGQGVSTMFNYGRAYGQVLGVLQACLIPYRLVSPTQWKKAMKLSPDKDRSRRLAIEMLPRAAVQFQRKMDEARAEAALIAWWYLHERGKEKRAESFLSTRST